MLENDYQHFLTRKFGVYTNLGGKHKIKYPKRDYLGSSILSSVMSC